MNRLVVIVGPTGIGKSKLALHLAQALETEIVNADSRQVYRYMDIGTAKPTPQELSLVPHHLIGIVKPDEDFSLAQYQQLAYGAIEDIQQRNKLALLVGGSGQYVWSVLEGWEIPQVPPDPEFRRSLEEKVARVGKDELYRELMEVDPVAAQRIDRYNVRRLIRALEVHQSTGTPISQLQKKEALPYNKLIIGLTTEREELYRKIDSRVDKMIEQGLVAEVEELVNRGYNYNLPAMSSIGYKQIGMFLRGDLTLAAAIQQIKSQTHRFVRQQYNWFRLEDNRIKWFNIQGEVVSEIMRLLAEFIKGSN